MSKNCQAFGSSKLSWEVMIDKFLAIIDEAHQLKNDHPRYLITPGFGRELASLSLECKRLGDAVGWLWNTRTHSETAGNPLLTKVPMGPAITRFAIFLNQTNLGRILIHNHFLRTIAKRLLRTL
jgi:hypothetical protein